MITIKELKQKIEHLNDDAIILIRNSENPLNLDFLKNIENSFAVDGSNKSNVIILSDSNSDIFLNHNKNSNIL